VPALDGLRGLAVLLVMLYHSTRKVPEAGQVYRLAPWYWAYLSNILIASRDNWRGVWGGHIDISWSLAIEEQFYLVWPLLVFVLSRRQLVMLLLALGVSTVAIRAGLLALDVGPVAVYVLTPSRLDGLVAGSFIALVARGESGLGSLVHGARHVSAGAGLALLGIGVWLGTLTETHVLMQTLGFTLLAWFFGAVLVLIVSSLATSLLVRVFEFPVLRLFGMCSYGLYLLHSPVQEAIAGVLYGAGSPFVVQGFDTPVGKLQVLLIQMLYHVLGIVLSLGVALVSWHCFEKQVLKLKRFFSYRRPLCIDVTDSGSGAIAATRVA
jgi:peptidoglycan/LPS O-acetylase OafA/YrhL